MKSWTLTLAIFATLVVAAPTAHAQAAEPAQPADAMVEPAPAAAPAGGDSLPGAQAAADLAVDEPADADSPWTIETGLELRAEPAGEPVAEVEPAAEAAPLPIAPPAEAPMLAGEAPPAVDPMELAREPSMLDAEPIAASDPLAASTPEENGLEPAFEPATFPAAPASAAVESGAQAVDSQGTRGRIHVVARGDTLWDIAAAYLRTPWVWPSIGQDNKDIENPHRIYPGDHIWISETEMRKVTPGEAAEMIAARSDVAPELPVEDPAEELPMLGGLAAMEEPAAVVVAPARRVLQRASIPGVADMSFVSEDKLSAATSIVSSVSPRTWLLEADTVVLGLGEGETSVGMRYDVFRDAVPVRDPLTTSVIGYHVEILGWLQVTAVHGDSSTGLIRMSKSEMMRGDRVIEREEVPLEFALSPAPPDLEGRIVYTPSSRTQMTQLDYVYLNRGAVHGLEVGAEVEVFEGGGLKPDRVRGTRVRTPDHRIASLVIVSVQPTTSVGFVTHTKRELQIGDSIRPMTESVAMR
jgi:nucleoid-associated protein YgaU